MSKKTKEDSRVLAGVLGFFNEPHDLVKATEKVRDANYESFDAFTPYPVHGLDDAQGLKRSSLPFVTFSAGLMGCTLGFLLQYWTSVVDWPINVAGKPMNSWPAFVPIMFECTILFAGLATAGGMFFFNRLPNITRRSFDPRLTCDRFALLIEAPLKAREDSDESDRSSRKKTKKVKSFDESEAAEFLKKLGAKDVKSVYAEGWF